MGFDCGLHCRDDFARQRVREQRAEAAELIANSKSEQRAPRFTIFRR